MCDLKSENREKGGRIINLIEEIEEMEGKFNFNSRGRIKGRY